MAGWVGRVSWLIADAVFAVIAIVYISVYYRRSSDYSVSTKKYKHFHNMKLERGNNREAYLQRIHRI